MVTSADEQAIDAFLAGDEVARGCFDAIRSLIEGLAPVEWRVTASQIACRDGRDFAWLWRPGRWLRGDVAPLVLSVALGGRDPSPRWKQVVEVTPGRWMHHLELRGDADVDADVAHWLAAARAMRG